MNPLIQFHVLPEPDGNEAFLKAAILLIEKIYQRHRNAHLIVLSDPQDLSALDDWLWTFIPTSFLPHAIEGETLPGEAHPAIIDLITTPKKITAQDSRSTLLINLSQQSIPTDQLSAYTEMHMIVGKSTEYREFCRSLFRAYKKHGISPLSEAIAL